MKDVETIKDRIKSRKHNIQHNHTYNRFYSFMIKFMLSLVLIISISTYIKISPNYKEIHKYLSQVISMKDLTQTFEKLLYNQSTVEVSKEVFYTQVKDNYYTNHTNEGTSLMEGIVVECGNAPILGNYVVVMNNNLKVTYGCLDNVFVSQYDEVDKSMIIGTYNDNIMLIFNEGDKEIDYSTFEERADSY